MNLQREFENKNKGIERIILMIFSIYDIIMILKVFFKGWSYSSCALLMLLLAAVWVLVVKQYHTFAHRSLISTVMIQFSILLFAFRVQDFYSTLPVIYVFSCIVSFYGISYYIGLSTFSAMIYFASQLIGAHVNPQGYPDVYTVGRHFINVLAFEVILFIWTTGRMESEKKVRQWVGDLQKQVQQQYELIGIIGDKIQNPVNRIKKDSLALREEKDFSNLQMGLRRVQGTCDYILGRAVDVTDYADICKDRVEVHEKEYDVVSLADGFIQSAMLLKQMSNVEFIFDFDGKMPKYLIGDIDKIRRAIFQLIENAFLFSTEGYVGLSIGGRKESYGYNLMISIRDLGKGMTQEELERIISNQVSVSDAMKNQSQGIGIGLFVCKKLIEKMGGTMMIRSEYGKGTEIQMVIPQKIQDDSYCITVPKGKKINVLIYINMEQFRMIEVRDAYMETMSNIAGQLPMGYQMCRNLSEMKRRAEGDSYTHIIITDTAYHEDEAYFDHLSLSTKLVLMMDRDEEWKVANNRVYYVYKPFFILSVVMVLWDIVEPNNYLGKDIKDRKMEMETRPDEVIIDKIVEIDDETQKEKMDEDLEQSADRMHEPEDSEKKKVQAQGMTEKAKEEKKEGELVIGDLDIKTATLYCGGEESFLMILTQFLMKAEETRAELVRLYEEEDWKNFVIKAHGLKSSMLSLGAKQLSDQAKEMEYAGKSEKYDLIHKKMEPLLAEYDRVIEMASAYPEIAKKLAVHKQNEKNMKRQDDALEDVQKQEREAITAEAFDAYIDQMEEYSYELDEQQMKKVLDELEKYAYQGKNLNTELKKIREKIEQSDFMSAADTLRKTKEKLDKKEDTHNG